jgi:LysM repeat protein
MHFPQVLVAGLVPAIASARALSRRAVDCSFTTSPSSGDKCDSFASSWGLTVDDLKALNPGISCPNLDTSNFYCVIGTVTGEPEPTTTTTTSKTTTRPTTSSSSSTTTTTTAPTVTNEPAMPGIVDDCDDFYKVSSGDQCDTIATEHGISKAQFLEWNTSVDDRKSTHSPGSHTPSISISFPHAKTDTA